MAPLYNRYIPPKVPAPKTQTSAATPAQVVSEQPKKRKRSAEEEAERKAKKENKKRQKLSSQPGGNVQASKPLQVATEETPIAPINPDVDASETSGAKRESAKKRHKREKEERRQKKEETKLVKLGVPDAASVDVAGGSGPQNEPNAQLDQLDVVQSASVPGRTEEDRETARSKKRRKDHGQESGQPQKVRRPNDGSGAERRQQTDPEAAEKQADGSATEPSLKKRKRKDRGLATSEEGNDGSVVREPTADAASSQRTGYVAESEQPRVNEQDTAVIIDAKTKKRRHRLESVLQEEVTVPGAEDRDEEHLKKHSNVLSKFAKSTRTASTADSGSQEAPAAADADAAEKRLEDMPVLHDLVPLPQAERAPTPEYRPKFSALPDWLANPITVASDTRQSFSELDLPRHTLSNLRKIGLDNSLAVQSALIPLLLTSGGQGSAGKSSNRLFAPDVCVSAPTGSGKTLAYCLPIIQALDEHFVTHALRALVVVPTRELVQQVADVATRLAAGTNVVIGTASGTANFEKEKTELVSKGRRYDPAEYESLMAVAHRRDYPPDESDEAFEDYLETLQNADPREQQHLQDAVECLVHHVPTYECTVDILVCTPGRLIEHLSSTLGFHVRDLEWLVIDEADKLVDQSYDQFIAILNDHIRKPRKREEQDGRERYLRKTGLWRDEEERRVRKVILSATMTRDVGNLAALKLQHPRMIVVKGAQEQQSREGADDGPTSREGDSFDLPPSLKEHSVPVGDGAEKPLYLLALLRERILTNFDPKDMDDDKDSEGDVDVSSDDSSDSSDDASASESDEAGGTESNDTSVAGDDVPADEMEMSDELEPSLAKVDAARRSPHLAIRPASGDIAPTVLIFTSSTEAANRLAHLLERLHPAYAPFITIMTRTTTQPGKRIRSEDSKPVICVSTDRAARGLDAIADRDITDVIQYDIPRSLTSYVHRVGRTARAGRAGEAWTLYTNPEARWFLKSVTQADSIKRPLPVEKVKIVSEDASLQKRYGEVLGKMKDMVFGSEPVKKGKGESYRKAAV